MNPVVTSLHKKPTKKEVRQLVYKKLSDALAEYQTSVKEKKFTNRLKKVSKLFAADIAKAIGKKNETAKKAGKKKTVTQIQPEKKEKIPQA